MIDIEKISRYPRDYASDEELWASYEKGVIRSYEDFIRKGHSWCWCLVGNIAEEHEFGEAHEILRGTKQFSPGAKVYMAPVQWGDGYEKTVVIGLPRHGGNFIEIVTRTKYITNIRMKKVFRPAVLRRMCTSPYEWWSDQDCDRDRIIGYLERLAPEEA